MTLRFDEKGKFYMNVVPKETVESVIQTVSNRITGCVHIRPGTRLKDEINREGEFLAVTNAVIFDATGAKLYQCEFLAVNLHHVVWIMPANEATVESDDLVADADS